MVSIKPLEDYKAKELETMINWATEEISEWVSFRRDLFAERKRRARIVKKK